VTENYRKLLARAGAIVALLLLLALGSVATSTASSAASSTSQSAAASANPVVDSPSPSLGATSQPNRPIPGDNDSDPNDWSGAPWIIAAVVVVAVLAGVITYVLFRGHRLTWRNQRTPEDPSHRRLN
jgi:flagellar basal body-associated protein FliL